MMHRLWFVVPAHGRVALSRVCLRQLRRTCDALDATGNFHASAVVIADDENLHTAQELGFATVRRDNRFLARKFNDGMQLACDARLNPLPADFVVPCGSDDWVDPACFGVLPGADTVMAFSKAAFVDESGARIVTRTIDYEGGVGIRIYPRGMLKRLDFRPADEDRKRGCDTSILVNLKKSYARTRRSLRVLYNDQHDYQVVDWKSPEDQLNAYADIADRFRGGPPADPFEVLAPYFPAEALDEMHTHYVLSRLAC